MKEKQKADKIISKKKVIKKEPKTVTGKIGKTIERKDGKKVQVKLPENGKRYVSDNTWSNEFYYEHDPSVLRRIYMKIAWLNIKNYIKTFKTW